MAFKCFRIPSKLISIRNSAADRKTPVGQLTWVASVGCCCCSGPFEASAPVTAAPAQRRGGCNAEEATD